MEAGRVERRLTAILAADMVGYSRLMEADEQGIILRQNAHRADLIDLKFSEYGGRIVKLMGDGMLVEFPSVVNAVQSAVEIQQEMNIRELDVSEDQKIQYRIGINLGDIIIDGDDILGDGVNVAARLEGLALPGGICISDVVHQSIIGKIDLNFENLGEQKVKNIQRPIKVFRILATSAASDPAAEGQNPKAPSEKPSIAVLAFNNMSGDPEQEYFSDGITEDIITGLSRIKDLLVIARNTSFTYKGRSVDVKQVGQELGVRYVLEGSVRRGGDRVRVTGQLIDTHTGGHVWADRYDGKLNDIFELQDEITAKVLGAVGTEITLAEIERVRSERSDNIDAWDCYLKALPLYYQISKAGHEQVAILLSEATEIDPKFSSAYAMLALSYVNAAHHAWAASAYEAISIAEELARKAVALDQQDPLGHVALGRVYMFKTQPGPSIKELNRAIELNPNLSAAFGMLSNSLGFMGRTDEALVAFERANRGSPRDPERYFWYTGAMNAHFAAEQYQKCVDAGEMAILLKPNFFGAHFITAAALACLGRIEEAKKAVEMVRSINPRINLTNTARNPMFVRQDDVARLLDGLRKAGLPE